MNSEMGTLSVREQLIIAGIDELEAHGIADFSLRRVASACNISCAAPYKHFESKEKLIDEIFKYIGSQLDLLLEQVAEIFKNDPKKRLTESGISYIRFCLANPHFRAIMTLSEDTLPLKNTVSPLLKECLPHISPNERTRRELLIRSLIYGGAVMLESGELPQTEDSISDIRKSIERTIDGY
ncbi:MAG: TetR/AcrR family transcriptional regulator [Clostridia bacterium]|nr:TetR/AcrR family transcriptional regulator [Clostridia bacterium]